MRCSSVIISPRCWSERSWARVRAATAASVAAGAGVELRPGVAWQCGSAAVRPQTGTTAAVSGKQQAVSGQRSQREQPRTGLLVRREQRRQLLVDAAQRHRVGHVLARGSSLGSAAAATALTRCLPIYTYVSPVG